MVSLTWIAGIIVILIGLVFLGYALYSVITGSSVASVEFIVGIIIAIALVLIGAWLAKGGRVAITE